MNGADIAASMIRAGAIPNTAFAAAARRTGEAFRDIARECSRRSAARRHAVAVRDVRFWRQFGDGMVKNIRPTEDRS